MLFGTVFASPIFFFFGTRLASLIHQHRKSVKMTGERNGGRKTAPHQRRTPWASKEAGAGPETERPTERLQAVNRESGKLDPY
jgi:hypothetical protein